MFMKRILSVLLCVIVSIVAFAACNSNDVEQSLNTSEDMTDITTTDINFDFSSNTSLNTSDNTTFENSSKKIVTNSKPQSDSSLKESSSKVPESNIEISSDSNYNPYEKPPNTLLNKTLAKSGDKKENKITKSYSLKELKDYFDGIYLHPFKSEKSSENYTYKSINKKFPIQFSRKGNESFNSEYYSVFKVKEGGYFYILWYEKQYIYCDEYETSLKANYACYLDKERNCSQDEVYSLLNNKNSTVKDINNLTWTYDFDIFEQQNYKDKFVAYLLCKEGYLKILFNNPSKDLEKMEAFYLDSVFPAKREDAYICRFSCILEEDMP